MIFSLYTLLFIAFIAIIIEDFKYRAIRWFWIPVLVFLCLGIAITENSWSEILVLFRTNVVFILIQLLGVSLYYSLKVKRLVNITDNYLGWGDILFFLPLCLLFSPINFIVFFIGGLMMILLGYILWKQFFLPELETIPLAGGLAIVAMVCLIGDYCSSWERYQDVLMVF